MSRGASLAAVAVLFFCCFARVGVAVEISTAAGKAEIRLEKLGEWKPVSQSAQLPSGAAVRTGSDGRVLLLFPGNSRVWMKENGLLEVEKAEKLDTILSLRFGSVKAKLSRLKLRESFQIKIGSATVSGGSTEFVLSGGENGTCELAVLFGEAEVERNDLGVQEKHNRYIPQGLVYRVPALGEKGLIELLSPQEESAGLEDWTPGLSPGERVQELVRKACDRNDLRLFAQDAGRTQQFIEDLAAQLREEDMAAGRTLRDIHGNLVRVEQRLFRPDASTLQIVNLVKRPVYLHNSGYFQYNGGAMTSRLDSIQTRIVFDKALPQNINDWNGFFRDSGVKPVRASFVAANQTIPAETFMVGYLAVYDKTADRFNDNETIYFGQVNKSDYNKFAQGSGIAAVSVTGEVTSAGLTMDGLLWAQNPAASGGWNELNPGQEDWRSSEKYRHSDGMLYEYSGLPYCVGADCSSAAKLVWLGQEKYVIGNDGRIKSVSSAVDSSSSISSFLKSSAGEVVLYIKNNNAAGSGLGMVGTADTNLGAGFGLTNPYGKNIDIVLIPDIGSAALDHMYAVFEKVIR